MLKKLKSNKGESLIESMVALLIVALGITLVATMVVTSGKLVEKGDVRLTKMYKLSNMLEAARSTEEKPDEIRQEAGEVTIKIGNSERIRSSKTYICSNEKHVDKKKKEKPVTLYSYRLRD